MSLSLHVCVRTCCAACSCACSCVCVLSHCCWALAEAIEASCRRWAHDDSDDDKD